MKSSFGIAIVGCGTVGNAAADLLLTEISGYQAKTDTAFKLRALVDVNFDRARAAGLDESLFNSDLSEVLANRDIHLIVETVGGLTIARNIIEKAIKAGKHVVTANKALLAHYGKELFALAHKNAVCIGFEASCAGGIPIVRALVDGLIANENEAIYGIVNGTSNFILTEMVEFGKTYTEALKLAQEAHLAEADPTLDVNGMDAAHKLTLLSSLAFGEYVTLDAIPVEGINKLNLFDVKMGSELGYTTKLLALARRVNGGLDLAVRPVFLPDNHPLAIVSGPFNAVSVYGNAVGHTMYYGRGAGGKPTASAVISDILSIAIGTWPRLFSTLHVWPDQCKKARIASPEESRGRHYLRFKALDKCGVVADIAAILARKNVSLNAFVQKETHEGTSTPIVITTHEAREKDIMDAFNAICQLKTVDEDAVRIRIIDEHVESLISESLDEIR